MNLIEIKSKIKSLNLKQEKYFGNFKKAGVLVILTGPTNNPHLLLTQRSSFLNEHAGQISFPGGKTEETDQSILETAYRETYEEIGLNSIELELISPLWSQKVLNKWLMQPFLVYWKKNTNTLVINYNEVEKIIKINLMFLVKQHYQKYVLIENKKNLKYSYYIPNSPLLWGATGHVIGRFLNCLTKP